MTMNKLNEHAVLLKKCCIIDFRGRGGREDSADPPNGQKKVTSGSDWGAAERDGGRRRPHQPVPGNADVPSAVMG